MIRLQQVDGFEAADELQALDRLAFGDTAPPIDPASGHWWVASEAGELVAYAGLKQSTQYLDCGYLCRVGVLPPWRGKGLQRRFIRVRENQARANGWRWLLTDCTPDNLASANSLMGRGFRLYKPTTPWAFKTSLYWRKKIS